MSETTQDREALAELMGRLEAASRLDDEFEGYKVDVLRALCGEALLALREAGAAPTQPAAREPDGRTIARHNKAEDRWVPQPDRDRLRPDDEQPSAPPERRPIGFRAWCPECLKVRWFDGADPKPAREAECCGRPMPFDAMHFDVPTPQPAAQQDAAPTLADLAELIVSAHIEMVDDPEASRHRIALEWAPRVLNAALRSRSDTEHTRRWNVEETDTGIRVCWGEHVRSAGCEWVEYVPRHSEQRLREKLKEVGVEDV